MNANHKAWRDELLAREVMEAPAPTVSMQQYLGTRQSLDAACAAAHTWAKRAEAYRWQRNGFAAVAALEAVCVVVVLVLAFAGGWI